MKGAVNIANVVVLRIILMSFDASRTAMRFYDIVSQLMISNSAFVIFLIGLSIFRIGVTLSPLVL
jgi:hypothetical protein